MRNIGRSLVVVAGMLIFAVSNVHADVWLNQDIEGIDGSVQWVGDATSEAGRWGYLSTARVSIAQAHSGTNSFRVARGSEGRGSVQGYTDMGTFGPGASSEKIFALSLWVYREAGAGNVITFGNGGTDGASATWGTTGNPYVRTDGLVQLYTGSAYQSFSTGTTVAEDTWTELKFEYDLTADTYGEVTASLGGTVLSTLALTDDFSMDSDRVTFSPQGATGTTVYFDDIQLEVIPEPATFGLFIISITGIILLRRMRI